MALLKNFTVSYQFKIKIMRAFRILRQLILTKYLRPHLRDLQNESPVETMSYSSTGLALPIS